MGVSWDRGVELQSGVYAHDHLLAAQKRVADELARAQGHLSFRHIGGCDMSCWLMKSAVSARLSDPRSSTMWRRMNFGLVPDYKSWRYGSSRSALSTPFALALLGTAITHASLAQYHLQNENGYRLSSLMDAQLELFRRQYLQLVEVDFLAWPPTALLRDAGVQAWLYKRLFNADQNARLPPESYQFRVCKSLVNRIEQSIEDPEEDVGVLFILLSVSVTVPRKPF